jgi:hypothetical protein
MRVCPSCNRPILDNSEFCPVCGSRVNMGKVKRAKTVDITATPADIKDWWRAEMVFIFLCLVFLVVGFLSIWVDLPLWFTILCFIGLALHLSMLLYSYQKVTDLKKRLRG